MGSLKLKPEVANILDAEYFVSNGIFRPTVVYFTRLRHDFRLLPALLINRPTVLILPPLIYFNFHFNNRGGCFIRGSTWIIMRYALRYTSSESKREGNRYEDCIHSVHAY